MRATASSASRSSPKTPESSAFWSRSWRPPASRTTRGTRWWPARIRLFGSDEQKADAPPVHGSRRADLDPALQEPDAGSDLASLQTRARLDGEHYVIDGQKVWSTWAQFADYGYLLARSEPERGTGGHLGLHPRHAQPRHRVRPLREMTGTNDFNEVFFDQVRVPAGNVIGAPGQGWKIARARAWPTERGGVGVVGSERTVALLVELARRGQRRGRPLIEDGEVREHIAGFAARSRIQSPLARRSRPGPSVASPAPADAPMGKIWFSELNLEMLEYALELEGPASILAEGDPGAIDDGFVQDAFLYARAWTIAGGIERDHAEPDRRAGTGAAEGASRPGLSPGGLSRPSSPGRPAASCARPRGAPRSGPTRACASTRPAGLLRGSSPLHRGGSPS